MVSFSLYDIGMGLAMFTTSLIFFIISNNIATLLKLFNYNLSIYLIFAIIDYLRSLYLISITSFN